MCSGVGLRTWEAVCSEACVSFEGLDRDGEGGRVANFLFTRGLCHLTGDGKNKTMKQMDKNCKRLSRFLSLMYIWSMSGEGRPKMKCTSLQISFSFLLLKVHILLPVELNFENNYLVLLLKNCSLRIIKAAGFTSHFPFLLIFGAWLLDSLLGALDVLLMA